MTEQIQLPKPNQRVAVYGPTGCGKTYFCKNILKQYANVIQIDFKHHLTVSQGDYEAENLKQLTQAMRKQDETGEHIIYRVPRAHLLKENAASLDTVAALAMERGNTILYYDDVVYVAGATDFQQRAPNFYYALTVGRGKGVGVWACSQRPSRIPVPVHTESDTRITFYSRRKTDRATIEESFGSDEIPWETLRRTRFSFVMGNDLWTSKPMKLRLT